MKSIVDLKQEMERIKNEIAQNRAKKEMLEQEILKITGVDGMEKVSGKLQEWETKLDKMEKKLTKLIAQVEDFVDEYDRQSETIN